jgi:hypothetical protein
MLLSVIMSWSFLGLSELVRLPNQIFVSLSTEFQILSESDAYTMQYRSFKHLPLEGTSLWK